MLSKCANPSCSASFRYLHEGKLFRVARRSNGKSNGNGWATKPPEQLEYYWLCDSCASQMTITRAQDGGIQAVPLLSFKAAS